MLEKSTPAPPFSKQFDDVYFSAVNGLAETKHVFLDGNNLPQAWRGRDYFTICETGFGTGLNVLSVWKLFEETAQMHQHLHVISVEKFPLQKEEIESFLSPLWPQEDHAYLHKLLEQYPLRINGFHKIMLSSQVTLTLIFGDMNEEFPKLNVPIDAWFLDGFKPASNPEMWSDILFKTMRDLSRAGSSFATFTAAGFVKRGLEGAGFDVKKVPGFGTKRDMLVGLYKPL